MTLYFYFFVNFIFTFTFDGKFICCKFFSENKLFTYFTNSSTAPAISTTTRSNDANFYGFDIVESILIDAKICGEDSGNTSNDAADATNTTNTSATGTTTRSSDTYIYGVGIVVFLVIGSCTFFAYSKKSFQVVNKKQAIKENINLFNHQNNAICFRYDGVKTL